jgi:flagellar hook assembly protein FlgD
MTKVGNVKIEVYNVLGKKVATLVNQVQVAGTHSVAWNSQKDDGSKVTSGVYFLRMQAGSFSEIKKMVLLK